MFANIWIHMYAGMLAFLCMSEDIVVVVAVVEFNCGNLH